MSCWLGTEPGYKPWFSWHTTGGEIAQKDPVPQAVEREGTVARQPAQDSPEGPTCRVWGRGLKTQATLVIESWMLCQLHQLPSLGPRSSRLFPIPSSPYPTQRHSPAAVDKLPLLLWGFLKKNLCKMESRSPSVLVTSSPKWGKYHHWVHLLL